MLAEWAMKSESVQLFGSRLSLYFVIMVMSLADETQKKKKKKYVGSKWAPLVHLSVNKNGMISL